MVIIRPITDRITVGLLKVPRAIEVDSLETTIPAFLKPIKAIKRPIPPLIAFFKDMGMAFTIAVRKPVTVIRIKMIPDRNTAARPACQEKPIVPQMV